MKYVITVILIILICIVGYMLFKELFSKKQESVPAIKSYVIVGGAASPTDTNIQFPQVSILSNHVLRDIKISSFVWSEKTDGLRTEILIEGKNVMSYKDRKTLAKLKKDVKRTILNTELLNDHYYIFDGMMIDGKDVSDKVFLDRYSEIKLFVEKYDPSFTIFKIKDYQPITKTEYLEEFIQNTVSPITGNKIDGVILQRTDLPYNVLSSFKYKRPVMNTIDFMLKYIPEKGVFFLYLWGTYKNIVFNLQKLPKINRYSKIHTDVDLKSKKYPDKFLVLFSSPFMSKMHLFVPNEHWSKKGYKRDDIMAINELMNKVIKNPIDYDGKIMEMSWGKSGWVPYRERWDKPKPNGYAVGEQISEILFSPVDFSGNRYFESDIEKTALNDTFHKVNKAIRKYMIKRLLTKYPTKTILDIAGGRGGDSNLFVEYGVNNIFAVDADKEAIVSYKNRLSKMFKKDLSFNGFGYALSEDNTELINDVMSRYEYNEEFSVAIMNYAIHYICDKTEKIMELARTLRKLLKKDGVFMFTYFDGDMMLSKAIENIVKLNSFTIKIDPDNEMVLMPLPTIDKSGYRQEPLVTKKKLEYLKMKVLDEYFPVIELNKELKEIDPKTDVIDLSQFIHVIICQILN